MIALIDAPYDVVKEYDVPIYGRGVHSPFGVSGVGTLAGRIYANNLMITHVLQQQAVSALVHHPKVVAVVILDPVLVPCVVAQVVLPGH